MQLGDVCLAECYNFAVRILQTSPFYDQVTKRLGAYHMERAVMSLCEREFVLLYQKQEEKHPNLMVLYLGVAWGVPITESGLKETSCVWLELIKHHNSVHSCNVIKVALILSSKYFCANELNVVYGRSPWQNQRLVAAIRCWPWCLAISQQLERGLEFTKQRFRMKVYYAFQGQIMGISLEKPRKCVAFARG